MYPEIQFPAYFDVECVNPDGSVAWRERFHNGTTSQGLNDNLSVYLGGGTQKTTWLLGLIDATGFSSLSAADTPSSHPGWNEFTAYNESVRQTWTPGSVSGGVISNPTPATFTSTGTSTIQGAFVISNSTKGGTTGVLWATGQFGTPQNLVAGQQLKVTYTLSAVGS